MIRGLVIEFIKTTPPAATAEQEPVPQPAAQILSTVPYPLMLIDRQIHLVWANRAFFEAFAVGPAVLGRPLSEAYGSPNEPPELWAFLQELVLGKAPRDVLIDHPLGRASDQPMRFSGRVVNSETDRAFLAMVFMLPV
jgi:hypothetical protein